MKLAEFNALNNVTTKAAALLLAEGTKFLFMDTQVHGKGTMPSPSPGNKGNAQQRVTALRHKIMYYVRDNSDIGYHPVYDILESDATADETKTATRPGLSRNDARDDNDRRDYRSTQWT
jgi:hypothetical protein